MHLFFEGGIYVEKIYVERGIFMGAAEAVILFLTIMTGFTLSGLVGFGGNILAMPVLSMFFPVRDIVPAFAVVSFVNSMFRFYQYRREIIWRRFWKLYLLMLSGTGIGIVLYRQLPESGMKLLLSGFIIGMAVYNLLKRDGAVLREGERDSSLAVFIFYHVLLFLGGVMQGAFVCGGPLLVIFCNHYFRYRRQVFLGTQWGLVFCNAGILLASHWMSGNYQGRIVWMSVVGVASLAAAFRVSALLSKRISDEGLRVAVNLVLLVSGCSNGIPILLGMLR